MLRERMEQRKDLTKSARGKNAAMRCGEVNFGLNVWGFISKTRCLTRVARGSPLQHLAEDVREDAAVTVVGDFLGGVDARRGGELFFFAVRGFGTHGERSARGE
jgi:hypothetical protein